MATQPSTSTDLLAAIYGRRAIRAFTPEPIDRATVEQLIDAAIQAPSYTDNEPWAFAVVQGAEELRGISDRAKAHFSKEIATHAVPQHLVTELADPAFNIFHGAPALIIVCATSERAQDAEDCCLAAENLMLAAFGLGLGTCPIGLARPWLRLAESKAELEIDSRFVPVFAIAVGHPAVTPPPPGRRSPPVAYRGRSATRARSPI